MIPGSNLLAMALRVIAAQSFTYNAFLSRALTSVGQYVATYKAPITVQGSVQPVPRELYTQYGLDFQRNYVIFYAPINTLDIKRDVSGDQIIFGCSSYQCVSITNWFRQDGWDGVLAVEVVPPNA